MVTTECDLQCKYCYEKSCLDIDSDFNFTVEDLPRKIDYNVEHLAAFCNKDRECVLSFYGGEPLLYIEAIHEILDKVKAKHFTIHTNGLHLHKLDPQYLNRLHQISVSIDGTKKLTDSYRGAGVYQRVTQNLALLLENGFQGEIIARMTVMEDTDIEQAVNWLLSNPDFTFSSVHWQLDAGFWKNDFDHRPFRRWVKDNYNPGVQRLSRFWVERMEKEGKVLRLYPFLGLMYSLLHEEKRSFLRCGSGWANYSILTDGSIAPCPIMGGMKDFYLGHILSEHPLQLKKIHFSEPCTSCSIFGDCGGRCLYANITKRWNNQAYSLVCDTVNNLLNSLKKEKEHVSPLIRRGKIKLSDFDYMKFSGCEIIP